MFNSPELKGDSQSRVGQGLPVPAKLAFTLPSEVQRLWLRGQETMSCTALGFRAPRDPGAGGGSPVLLDANGSLLTPASDPDVGLAH